jgi:hypothetical protein
VLELDGRRIGSGARGPMAARRQGLYDELVIADGTPITG